MTDIKQYEPLWGSWYVDKLIGEGSFGKVYRVKKEEFGRTYYSAVKIISIPQSDSDLRQLKNEGLDDVSLRSYFQSFAADVVSEIDLMSEFRGTGHIVGFEDHKVIEKTDVIGWDILIRMELLTSLSDYANDKPLTPDDVVKLGIHICRALEICAVKNTIHRDIKPDNIFISQYGDFKLGDFGIARQIERTTSGLSKKGTYTYMAPEVYKGDKYGASVDTYSLGIVMYRYLNRNRTPFLPDFPKAVMPSDRDRALERRMSGETLPQLTDVAPELERIVRKACAFDRSARFASATEMREALEALGRDVSVEPMRVIQHSAKVEPPAIDATVALFAEKPNTEATVGVFSQPPVERSREATSMTEGVFSTQTAETGNNKVLDGFEMEKSQKEKEASSTYILALTSVPLATAIVQLICLLALDSHNLPYNLLNNLVIPWFGNGAADPSYFAVRLLSVLAPALQFLFVCFDIKLLKGVTGKKMLYNVIIFALGLPLFTFLLPSDLYYNLGIVFIRYSTFITIPIWLFHRARIVNGTRKFAVINSVVLLYCLLLALIQMFNLISQQI
jgi:serine/threonine protein kinase